jgi:hypothetical protein
VILVSDRGMATIENLALLRQGYLVGLKRRRNAQVNRYIEAAAQGRWQECPVGITAREKEKPPPTMVTEVAGEEPWSDYRQSSSAPDPCCPRNHGP